MLHKKIFLNHQSTAWYRNSTHTQSKYSPSPSVSCALEFLNISIRSVILYVPLVHSLTLKVKTASNFYWLFPRSSCNFQSIWLFNHKQLSSITFKWEGNWNLRLPSRRCRRQTVEYSTNQQLLFNGILLENFSHSHSFCHSQFISMRCGNFL